MKCQETSGFLTLHQCENPATLKCQYCKKHVCGEHARPIEEIPEGEEQGVAAPPGAASMPAGMAPIPGLESDLSNYTGPVSCITCMKKRFAEPTAQGVNNRKTRWFRSRYYYDPYFYGYYYGYSPYGVTRDYDRGDYAVFDRTGDTDTDVETADVDSLEDS